MRKLLILFSALMFVFLSCEKEPEPVEPDQELEITVTPYFDTQKLNLDSVYTTDEGYKIQFEEIRFYLTGIKNGSASLTSVGMFDFKAKGSSFVKVVGNFSNFSSLTTLLGVDSLTNHSDPSAFDNDSPLNIQNANDMHWGWNPGYVFVYINAKADTIPDATLNLNHFVTYHVGTDEMAQNLNFSALTWSKKSDYLHSANMKLDLKKFLTLPQGINLKTEYISHSAVGQEALSLKVMSNFAAALTFD